jgi:hypothetical protein
MLRPFRMAALLGVLCLLLLAGCKRLENLRVENRYPFAILLKQRGDAIGTVPAHGTRTFAWKAGFDGSDIDRTTYEDERGKLLGTLRSPSRAARSVPTSGFNSPAVWHVIVGPAAP